MLRLRTRVMNFLERWLGPPSSSCERFLGMIQANVALAVERSHSAALRSTISTQRMDQKRALDLLEGALCDHDGRCCVAGSEGDRKAVDEALDILRGKPRGQEITIKVNVDTSAVRSELDEVIKQIEAIQRKREEDQPC